MKSALAGSLAAIQAAIACSNDSLRRMLLGYQAAKTSIAVARLAGSCVLSAAWKLSYSAGLAKLAARLASRIQRLDGKRQRQYENNPPHHDQLQLLSSPRPVGSERP